VTAPATTLPIAMDGRRCQIIAIGGLPGKHLIIPLRNHDGEIAVARALAAAEGRET
jgi:hypothetical protein